MKNLLVLLLLTFGYVTLSQAQLVSNGLIAHYPFCGNANDYSNQSNNGTVMGATLAADRFGNTNSAYHFNGSTDYIACGNNSILNGHYSGLTLSAWIYCEPGGSTDQQIVGKWNNVTSDDHYIMRLVGNKILVAIGHPSASSPGHINGNITLNDNTWYHIVFTWDHTGRHKIYINKTLDLNAVDPTFAAMINNSPVNLQIGRQMTPSYHNRAFKGLIDDIRIYNRALSFSEISLLYERDYSCHPIYDKQSVSSIDDAQKEVTITPNPASHFINVTIEDIAEDETFDISLYSLQGKLIKQHTAITDYDTQISVKDLPKGIYLVAVTSEKTHITKKLLLK